MKDPHLRHTRAYRILRPLVHAYLKIALNFTSGKVPELQAPYLVLANHVTDFDPFMVACSFPQQMYFLASEHVYRMGFLSKIIGWLLAPISRVKGTSDATAVLQMMRALRKGHNVCFFPEGSRTFSGETIAIHPTTAKMVQKAGVTLVTCRIRGGYLTSPRWAKTLRRGKCRSEFVAVYTPEDLRAMTTDQVAERISRDLYVNAFEDQKAAPVAYHKGRRTEGLEEALHTCPVCKETGTLRGTKDHFRCSCGLDVKLDSTGFFHKGAEDSPELPFNTVLAWDRWQTEYLKSLLPGSPDAPFFADDDFRLDSIDGDHSMTHCETGLLALYPDRLTLGSRTFPLADLQELAIIHRKKRESLLFSCGGTHYELSSESPASRSKYHTLFQLLKAQQ
ncbi:MAG: 1-acyl-sn-glycerol-3-phosphate acyltransferase [Firmicutes bacterium]|nr:1-acyl-sn-glycerol-3-phosphate acyltransferase [Bacillota bacterium]